MNLEIRSKIYSLCPIEIVEIDQAKMMQLKRFGLITLGSAFRKDIDTDLLTFGVAIPEKLTRIREVFLFGSDEDFNSLGLPAIVRDVEDLDTIRMEDLPISPEVKSLLADAGIVTLNDLSTVRAGDVVVTDDYGYAQVQEAITSIGDYFLGEGNPECLHVSFGDVAGSYLAAGPTVDSLCLPTRAKNALLNNGILTVGQILENYESLCSLKGLGITAVEDIGKVLEETYIPTLDPVGGCQVDLYDFEPDMEAHLARSKSLFFRRKRCLDASIRPSIKDILGDAILTERNRDIFIKYTCLEEAPTLEQVANEYGITRERTRQIINKCQKRVRDYLVQRGHGLEDFCRVPIKDELVEIHMVRCVDDESFSSYAIAKIMASVFPEKINIYSGPKIHGEWASAQGIDVDSKIDDICVYLGSVDEMMPLDDISKYFGVSREFILSIKAIMFNGTNITTRSNHLAKPNSQYRIILDFMKVAGRPVSVFDIAENTGIEQSVIRGVFNHYSDFVNVGKSTYVVEGVDYSEKSINQLVFELLYATCSNVKFEEVFAYVKRYKSVDDNEVYMSLCDDSRILCGYSGFSLRNPPKKVPTPKRGRAYEVEILDAIAIILKEYDDIFTAFDMGRMIHDKFGNGVSNNINTLKMALGKLCDEERVVRVGDYNSGFYRRSDYF